MKRLSLIVFLLWISPVYGQLQNLLNKNVDDIAQVRNDQTLLDSLFFTSKYSQAIVDITSALDTTFNLASSYATIQAAIDEHGLPGKKGWVIIPADYPAAETYVLGDSTIVLDLRNGTFSINGVFQTTGTFVTPEEKYSDIISFYPLAVGGAILDTLNDFEEVLDFTTDDSVSNKTRLLAGFTGIDSIEFFASTDSTLGDSVSFGFEFYQRADNEPISGTFTSVIADTIDLGVGVVAGVRRIRRMVITSGFPTLIGNRVTLILLRRISGILNNQSGNVSIHEIIFYFR